VALTRAQLTDLRECVYEFVEAHPRYAASTIKAEVCSKWGYAEYAVGSALAALVRGGLLHIVQGGTPDYGAVHAYPAYLVVKDAPDVDNY